MMKHKSQLEISKAYKSLEETIEGKLILNDLSYFCGENACCFDATNQSSTNFMLGARSVFLYIKEQINRDLEQIKLKEEALKQKQETDNVRRINFNGK